MRWDASENNEESGEELWDNQAVLEVPLRLCGFSHDFTPVRCIGKVHRRKFPIKEVVRGKNFTYRHSEKWGEGSKLVFQFS